MREAPLAARLRGAGGGPPLSASPLGLPLPPPSACARPGRESGKARSRGD